MTSHPVITNDVLGIGQNERAQVEVELADGILQRKKIAIQSSPSTRRDFDIPPLYSTPRLAASSSKQLLRRRACQLGVTSFVTIINRASALASLPTLSASACIDDVATMAAAAATARETERAIDRQGFPLEAVILSLQWQMIRRCELTGAVKSSEGL